MSNNVVTWKCECGKSYPIAIANPKQLIEVRLVINICPCRSDDVELKVQYQGGRYVIVPSYYYLAHIMKYRTDGQPIYGASESESCQGNDFLETVSDAIEIAKEDDDFGLIHIYKKDDRNPPVEYVLDRASGRWEPTVSPPPAGGMSKRLGFV